MKKDPNNKPNPNTEDNGFGDFWSMFDVSDRDDFDDEEDKPEEI